MEDYGKFRGDTTFEKIKDNVVNKKNIFDDSGLHSVFKKKKKIFEEVIQSKADINLYNALCNPVFKVQK